MDKQQLTARQREIYEFIVRNDARVTVREIGLEFFIKSPNGVQCHLKALEAKGFIKTSGGKARNIQLVAASQGADLQLKLDIAMSLLFQADQSFRLGLSLPKEWFINVSKFIGSAD